ncbi:hypothetical protein [Nonomuraea angiospora]|uniref:hypothetical protein n=1 Tax=Nonomuraea angiospora TaxID=46172 RepID=UPI0029BA8B19|nr:hypothetical protein [Nonomuraea angiospora]MDX3109711.1 hypothetical protein [Nonomuraea angiospora]
MSTNEPNAIDALAHLAEEVADDVRREAIKTSRTVRTTPKPKDPKGGSSGNRK